MRFTIVRNPIVLLVTANFLLFLDGTLRHYPTVDETRLVPAGLVHWRTGDFSTANDVPPLARLISAVPVLAATPFLDPCVDFERQKYWTEAVGLDRASQDASRFIYHNRNQFVILFCLARVPNFLWWAMGAWIIYHWANNLYGKPASCLGLIFWSLGPNILAREQMATPDLPVAVAVLATSYAFLGWLRKPDWNRAALTGILLGIALLADFAVLALLPAWVSIGTARWFLKEHDAPQQPAKSWAGQLFIGTTLCLWVLNSGYLFSQTAPAARDGVGGSASGLTSLATLVPSDYREGLAQRWRDSATEAGDASISTSASARGGFSWTMLAWKIPLGTLALILGGAATSFRMAWMRSGVLDQLAVWAPPVFVLVLASTILAPILPTSSVLILAAPFAIIGISSLSIFFRPAFRTTRWLILGLLASVLLNSLTTYPSFLCCLNEAASGTQNATSLPRWMSGRDCGQDFGILKSWLREHPESRPIGLACRQIVDPQAYGLEYTIAPSLNSHGGSDPKDAPWYSLQGGPHPGWYAVDAYSLGTVQYAYFKDFKPLQRLGASLFIYNLSRDDVESARRHLHLSPLAETISIPNDALHDGFVRRSYRDESGVEYNYAVFAPPGHRSGRSYPLILFLHGYDEREGGPRGDAYLDVTFPLAVKQRRDNFPFFAVVPQGRSGGWSPGGTDARMVLAVLKLVQDEYEVDPKRIYLTGVSSGGAGVWSLAAEHPELWAAIVPIATAGCDPDQAQRISNIPCWCFHNLYDFKYPITNPRAMIGALRQAGGLPRYTEFFGLTSDVGRSSSLGSHDAWSKAYMLDALYAWLSQQTR
ncbi:glycosyltransferase family 39 protein [Singulisphaera acidiphila]|uniref:Glycosyltransferase RgtA/B/C/D-like domain-containing protein n=1 Tax=Singulisphaera acidiphila (strain ATCC BAA-1392 / DSM 18658 / VKM B-2454 / MOB10) TaxID=886293 RepID=L0DDS2_SINAD|nr:glycosyltransferase family 39 protein [Singulisphaera acidiphila]AGA27015.1 hypothetical protein Sinac_2719 [Singulisphaera acidiphila DSM 18658]